MSTNFKYQLLDVLVLSPEGIPNKNGFPLCLLQLEDGQVVEGQVLDDLEVFVDVAEETH